MSQEEIAHRMLRAWNCTRMRYAANCIWFYRLERDYIEQYCKPRLHWLVMQIVNQLGEWQLIHRWSMREPLMKEFITLLTKMSRFFHECILRFRDHIYRMNPSIQEDVIECYMARAYQLEVFLEWLARPPQELALKLHAETEAKYEAYCIYRDSEQKSHVSREKYMTRNFFHEIKRDFRDGLIEDIRKVDSHMYPIRISYQHLVACDVLLNSNGGSAPVEITDHAFFGDIAIDQNAVECSRTGHGFFRDYEHHAWNLIDLMTNEVTIIDQ